MIVFYAYQFAYHAISGALPAVLYARMEPYFI